MINAIRSLCALAALATLVIMVLVGTFSSASDIALFLGFALFVNAPYALGWFLAARLGEDAVACALFTVVVGVAAAFCLVMYWWTFFAERQTDAQDALVFVVLPVLQTGAVIAAFVLAKGVAWYRG